MFAKKISVHSPRPAGCEETVVDCDTFKVRTSRIRPLFSRCVFRMCVRIKHLAQRCEYYLTSCKYIRECKTAGQNRLRRVKRDNRFVFEFYDGAFITRCINSIICLRSYRCRSRASVCQNVWTGKQIGV